MSEWFDQLVEEKYQEVEECLRRERIWDKVVRRFPPKAIESAVRTILKRFLDNREDYELLDWCSTFAHLPDFDSIAEFIEYLDRNNYIPPEPERAIQIILEQLERQAAELGYRLVKEEEWAKVTGRYDRLKYEIERLGKEKRRLEARVKQLESQLEEYKRTGKFGLRRFMVSPFTPTKQPPKPVQPPPQPTPPPPPPPPPPKPRIKDKIDYDELVYRVKSILAEHGLTPPVVDAVVKASEQYLRESWENEEFEKVNAVLRKVLEYTVSEFIPTRYKVLSLAILGVLARPPAPTWFRVSGGYVKAPPTIEWVYPRFVDWVSGIEKANYAVTYEPVEVTPLTHFIHDPRVRTEEIVVAVDEGNRIVLSSVQAIAYILDTDRRTLKWYRYPACTVLIR